MEPDTIVDMIRTELPDAIVELTDLTGTRDHWSAIVVSSQFEGLLLIKQHRMVNKALAEPLKTGELHALQLKTLTPAEWEAYGG